MDRVHVRISRALHDLSSHDLEIQAICSIRNIVCALDEPDTQHATLVQILTGLDLCDRSAARARLQLATLLLHTHGGAALGVQALEVVQPILLYAQVLTHTIAVDELCAFMSQLLSCLEGRMLHSDSLSLPSHKGGMKELSGTAWVLTHIVRPLARLAYRASSPSCAHASCMMLSSCVLGLQRHAEHPAVLELVAGVMATCLQDLGPGLLASKVGSALQPLHACWRVMGSHVDAQLARRLLQRCQQAASPQVGEWQLRRDAATLVELIVSTWCQVQQFGIASNLNVSHDHPQATPGSSPDWAQCLQHDIGSIAKALGDLARHDRHPKVRQAAARATTLLAQVTHASSGSGHVVLPQRDPAAAQDDPAVTAVVQRGRARRVQQRVAARPADVVDAPPPAAGMAASQPVRQASELVAHACDDMHLHPTAIASSGRQQRADVALPAWRSSTLATHPQSVWQASEARRLLLLPHAGLAARAVAAAELPRRAFLHTDTSRAIPIPPPRGRPRAQSQFRRPALSGSLDFGVAVYDVRERPLSLQSHQVHEDAPHMAGPALASSAQEDACEPSVPDAAHTAPAAASGNDAVSSASSSQHVTMHSPSVPALQESLSASSTATKGYSNASSVGASPIVSQAGKCGTSVASSRADASPSLEGCQAAPCVLTHRHFVPPPLPRRKSSDLPHRTTPAAAVSPFVGLRGLPLPDSVLAACNDTADSQTSVCGYDHAAAETPPSPVAHSEELYVVAESSRASSARTTSVASSEPASRGQVESRSVDYQSLVEFAACEPSILDVQPTILLFDASLTTPGSLTPAVAQPQQQFQLAGTVSSDINLTKQHLETTPHVATSSASASDVSSSGRQGSASSADLNSMEGDDVGLITTRREVTLRDGASPSANSGSESGGFELPSLQFLVAGGRQQVSEMRSVAQGGDEVLDEGSLNGMMPATPMQSRSAASSSNAHMVGGPAGQASHTSHIAAAQHLAAATLPLTSPGMLVRNSIEAVKELDDMMVRLMHLRSQLAATRDEALQ